MTAADIMIGTRVLYQPSTGAPMAGRIVAVGEQDGRRTYDVELDRGGVMWGYGAAFTLEREEEKI